MFDLAGNILNVGDKVKILKSDYGDLVGRVVTVMTPDCEGKIRVSLGQQWQGYYKFNEIMKVDNMIKNADYFRRLQGGKTTEEKVEEDIKHILGTIESFIIRGGKKHQLDFTFNITENHCNMLVDKLNKEYGFMVYKIQHNGDNSYSFVVDWS